MHDPGNIRIADYDYDLLEERIAQFPLSDRDASRLLICRQQKISQDHFKGITDHIEPGTLLVFNNTKVVKARLFFRKVTGAPVEIFCLEPLLPVSEWQKALQESSGVTWKCMAGNMKRWKNGTLIMNLASGEKIIRLLATRVQLLDDGTLAVRFDWDPPELTFGHILDLAGLVPLPPYIHRSPEPLDDDRYQTIYAMHDGSVAAPTAGLHFTEQIMDQLRKKKILQRSVTLHVGAGTFKPVTTDLIGDHSMHHERIIVQRSFVRELIAHQNRPVVAVGTTSARTLESIYWLGVRAFCGKPVSEGVDQWEPYLSGEKSSPDTITALTALLRFLDQHEIEEMVTQTRLIIVPGYQFRIVCGLITNFHMPRSTLLLLVAALIGPEWKKVYEYALSQGYRFLSYGDACLFYSSPAEK